MKVLFCRRVRVLRFHAAILLLLVSSHDLILTDEFGTD